MEKAKLIKSRAVASDHNAGMTIQELAKKYELTTVTIRKYIHEAEERKTNSAAVAQKAEKQKQIKAERDNERRNTMKVRSDLAEKRKKKVLADIEDGLSTREVAEKEGLSYCTVTDYIRGEKIPEGALTYKETIRTGQRERVLRKWAQKKVGNTIKTPDGKMTIHRVYPHIVECAKQYTKGFIVTTFTLAEVYYINQGGAE